MRCTQLILFFKDEKDNQKYSDYIQSILQRISNAEKQGSQLFISNFK
ncbi:unnamed protein product [Paramecium sonneborni]|uniref:Uncharacterized protein n=1 Tax=Paramecium sonneborni TaxID=65129 RepID=A0A8S1RRF1_9CILI|nr:unnamed protein product [Paramecium sonneborni]